MQKTLIKSEERNKIIPLADFKYFQYNKIDYEQRQILIVTLVLLLLLLLLLRLERKIFYYPVGLVSDVFLSKFAF